MKFCIITPAFYPTNNGMANVNYGLAEELIRLGHKVEVIVNEDDYLLKDYEIYNKIKIYRIKQIKFKKFKLNQITFILKAIKKIKKIKPDIIYGNDISMGGLVSGIAGKLYKINSIVQSQGGDIYYELLRNKWYKPINLLSLKLNNKIIVLNIYHKKVLLNYCKGLSKKLCVIPNGFKTPELSLTKQQCIKKLKFDSKNLNILFCGRLIQRKQPLLAVQSIKDIPNAILHMLGDGEELPKIKKYIQEYKLKDKVFLYGEVPRKIATMFYKASDIFLFPSRGEGSAGAIYEAFYSKLPTIASDIFDAGAHKDQIKNKYNGILVENNQESLKKAIMELNNDKKLQKKLTENAYKLITTELTWERITKKILSICTPKQLKTV